MLRKRVKQLQYFVNMFNFVLRLGNFFSMKMRLLFFLIISTFCTFHVASSREVNPELKNLTKIQISPNEKYFAVGNINGVVKVYSLPDGKLIKRFTGHVGKINTLTFTKDGKRLFSGGFDLVGRMWKIEENGELDSRKSQTFKLHRNPLLSIKLFEDDKKIAIASADNSISIWDIENNLFPEQVIEGNTKTSHRHEITDIAITKDNKTLVSCSKDRLLKTFNLEKQEHISDFVGHRHQVVAVKLLDDKYIISASEDRKVIVWNRESQKILKSITPAKETFPIDIALFPKSKESILILYDNGTLSKVTLTTGKINNFFSKKKIISFSVSPTGKYLLLALSNNIIKIIELYK